MMTNDTAELRSGWTAKTLLLLLGPGAPAAGGDSFGGGGGVPPVRWRWRGHGRLPAPTGQSRTRYQSRRHHTSYGLLALPPVILRTTARFTLAALRRSVVTPMVIDNVLFWQRRAQNFRTLWLIDST